MAKEKERITLYLSRHLKDRVEAAAKARRTSMNKLAISALRSRVDGILRHEDNKQNNTEET